MINRCVRIRLWCHKYTNKLNPEGYAILCPYPRAFYSSYCYVSTRNINSKFIHKAIIATPSYAQFLILHECDTHANMYVNYP